MGDSLKQSFQAFLEEFSRHHHGEVTAADPLPMRILSHQLAAKEVEAECMDWVLQYLSSKCPYLLAAHLARSVVNEILKLDLSAFVDDEDDFSNHKKEVENKAVEVGPNTVLQVAALAPVVFSTVHKICDEWDTQLPNSVLIHSPNLIYQVSACAIKNRRRKMEDRHIILPHLSELFNIEPASKSSLFGVFDGHGGLHASAYAAACFAHILVKDASFSGSPSTAIRHAFKQTDKDFCIKAERECFNCGTTGVCALVQDGHVYFGWLGDSEALLVREGCPVKVVSPHKPNRQDEIERIQNLGGYVEVRDDVHRVNGLISVARAIGDRNLKPFLCADADVTTVPLDGREDYIIVACDGLWDVVTYEEAVSAVYQHTQQQAGDKSQAARALVKLAQENGSEDNITVLVVFLRDDDLPPPHAAASGDHISKKLPNQRGEEGETKGSPEKHVHESSSDSLGQEGAAARGGKESEGSTSKSSSDNIKDQKQAGSGTVHSMQNIRIETDSKPESKTCSKQHGTELQDKTVSPIPTSKASSSKKHRSFTEDRKSEASDGSDMLLMSQTANRCINSRRGRRGRNGRRRNNHRDARRSSRESQNSGIALRTNGTPARVRSSSESKVYSIGKSSREAASLRGGGEAALRMLIGCPPQIVHQARSQNRWTVAVEIELESASAMFDDNKDEFSSKVSYRKKKF